MRRVRRPQQENRRVPRPHQIAVGARRTEIPSSYRRVQLKSLDNLHQHNQEPVERRVEDDPLTKKLQVAKRIVWMCLLSGSFLFYYLLDKIGEAISILR